MALTIADVIRSINPNIGLVQNADGTFRISVEDVNSDEILAAVGAMSVEYPRFVGLNSQSVTVTTGGTGVRLIDVATPRARKVIIQAMLNNSGVVCVGGINVVAAQATRTGTALTAGDIIEMDTDPYNVFVDSVENGDGVTWTAFLEPE